MAVKVLALASGVTGLADHRLLEGSLLAPAGTIAARGGVLPGLGSGNLTTVSAMVARVAPVKVVIPNGVSAALGPYILVSDSNVDITFDAGEASVARVDRIIARAYDNTNDGSGLTEGSIYYLKGTSGGGATALPTNSVLLYEMTVPAGASAGGGGINFANAVDQRVYTSTNGGIIPVASNTAMAAITSPYEGMAVYRTDIDVLYIYDGTNFKARGQASVASSASLSTINNPYEGMVAVTRDTAALYIYAGGVWTQPKIPFKPMGRLVAQSEQALADATFVALLFGSGSEEFDTYNFHSTASNTSRVTPTFPGYYKFRGSVYFFNRADYASTTAAIRKNGVDILHGPGRAGNQGNAVVSVPVEATILMNGTTDYVELIAQQDNTANAAGSTRVSSYFASTFEWEYVGPTSY